jgi:catechol 1,2-dioxygenase
MKRRMFIKKSSITAFSVSAFGTLQWDGESFVGDSPTTTDILGPFYRPGAPFRSDLIPKNSKGKPITLKGIIFKEDGKSPLKDALVEIWQCDEKEHYDNDSDEYLYRGALKTGENGSYEFKTILPSTYKADPDDDSSWRPAHIHMRVSVPNQQDLITQLYFKGGKYNDTDTWASSKQAVNRILEIKNKNGVSEVTFNAVLGKEIPLDKAVYKKITGLYKTNDMIFEFVKNDDIIFMKRNGQIMAALNYVGNNTFEGGKGDPQVKFELLSGGGTKALIKTEKSTLQAEKFLKYNE